MAPGQTSDFSLVIREVAVPASAGPLRLKAVPTDQSTIDSVRKRSRQQAQTTLMGD